MSSLVGKIHDQKILAPEEAKSIFYHDIFDYPLTFAELIKWRIGKGVKVFNKEAKILNRGEYYFLQGREGNILKRVLRQRTSRQKIKIARKYGRILSFIPSIKLIAVTGALAMENADKNSDIDLLIIASAGRLWTTRLIALLILAIIGAPVRRFNDQDFKDKLCLNIWMDENKLEWDKKERNIYTSHEISQIKPMVNKEKTYERLLWENRWIRSYWPNAVKIENKPSKVYHQPQNSLEKVIEKLAFNLQYAYMKKKITREVVTKKRALFHPNDWGRVVFQRLKVPIP